MKVTIVLCNGKTLSTEKVDKCEVCEGRVYIKRNGMTIGVFEMENIAGFYTEDE